MLALLFLTKLLYAMHLSIELLYHEIMVKYLHNFNDAINMCRANHDLIPFILPIIEIKRHCFFNNAEAWPLSRININGLLNQQCLELLKNHSHLYELASITIPVGVPLMACETIELLETNHLTIIFPDYNQYNRRNNYRGTVWSSIDSFQLNSLMARIPITQKRRISISMR